MPRRGDIGKPSCPVVGCESNQKGKRGYCELHYKRIQKGLPLESPRGAVGQRPRLVTPQSPTLCPICGRPTKPHGLRYLRTYCSWKCSGIAQRKVPPGQEYHGRSDGFVFCRPSDGLWVARHKIKGHWKTVTGQTREIVNVKLELIRQGFRLSDPRYLGRGRVPVEMVRQALALLIPLDHLYRLDRQGRAVQLLELAIRYAEAGFVKPAESPEPVVQSGPAPRHRPAWLESLPLAK